MRLTRLAMTASMLLLPAASSVRAEYVALRNGQRLHVTGYQLIGDKYRLQLSGGFVEVAVEEVVSIEPEDSFVSVPPPPAPIAPYKEIVKAAAAKYAVEEELINSVIAAESNFDPKAVSKKNACGLMQLLPETAARFGVQNIFDPKENIEAGTHYLSDLLKQYKNDLALALAAYNAGPERVTQFGRVPPYNETISYVRRVKKTYEKNKSGQALGLEQTMAPGQTSVTPTNALPKQKASSLSQTSEKTAAPAPADPPATLPN